MIPLLLPSCPRPLPAPGLHSFHSSLILVPRVLGPFGQGLVFPLPPLSAPGSPRMCPSRYYRRNKAINVFSTKIIPALRAIFFLWSQAGVMVRTEMSRNPLIVQSRYHHGQRTWAESSSLHRSVLRWLILSYFEGNIPLFRPCQEEKFTLLESA